MCPGYGCTHDLGIIQCQTYLGRNRRNRFVSIKPFFQELKGRMKKHIALIARAPINAQTLPNWPQQFPTQHPRRQKIASNETLF